MRVAKVGVAAAFVAATALGAATTAQAAKDPAMVNRFGPRRDLRPDDYQRTPLSLAPDRTMRVMIQVAGPSVAEARGDALDRNADLSAADAESVRTAAATTQNAVEAQVQQRGGRVDARFQDAINAVSAVVPAAQVAGLSTIPGVVAVTPVRLVERTNATSNAYTGVPAAWQAFGVTGQGVTIAVIDDGLDYTHADFGGPGTPAAYTNNNRNVIERGTFPTTKVIGGRDFVGDTFDAASDDPAVNTPKPDPDPLACGHHGTHVAGTAGGYGVLANGTTFGGPYTQAGLAGKNFLVAPGSAPEASLLSYQVFGCEGSSTSDIIVAAIDRAVADGADVINLSVGSDGGRADDPDAIAADNAVRAGVVVVASAGNEGPSAYMVGSPGTSKRALSVGAIDAVASFPGASINGVPAINANNGPLPVRAPVRVLRTSSGAVSLGCEADDYAGVIGTIVVTLRGVCARIDRAVLGQLAGAVAVVMINNVEGLPPFEGSIPGVTIPFLGVDDGAQAAVVALDGRTITIQPSGLVPNPAFRESATFTSGGPRTGDSGQKPDLTAPGVSVASASVGTGTQSENNSGTSMSTPHVSGIAALAVQAHPDWRAEFIKAALVNTADPGDVLSLDTRLDGSGVVDPSGAIATTSVALAGEGEASVNFTYQPSSGPLDIGRELSVVNRGDAPQTYALVSTFNGDALGAEVMVSPASVTVPPGGRADVNVQLRLSAAAVAALPPADQGPGATTVRGIVTATPAAGEALRVPFILTPHGLSDIRAQRDGNQLVLDNAGIHAGDADLYAWLLNDRVDRRAEADLRAVGAQVFDAPPGLSDVPGDKLLVFGVSLHNRFSNPTASEYDLLIDRNGDGNPEVVVFAADEGRVLAGVASGVLSSFTFDLATQNLTVLSAIAPTNGTSVLVAALASDLGLSATRSRFSLSVETMSVAERLGDDRIDNVAMFDAWNPQLSQGDFVPLAPGQSATVPLTVRPPMAGERPALGWMVITLDDAAGDAEADLVRL